MDYLIKGTKTTPAEAKILKDIILVLAKYKPSPEVMISQLLEHITTGGRFGRSFGLCGCIGPKNGEPYCPCIMRKQQNLPKDRLLIRAERTLEHLGLADL